MGTTGCCLQAGSNPFHAVCSYCHEFSALRLSHRRLQGQLFSEALNCSSAEDSLLDCLRAASVSDVLHALPLETGLFPETGKAEWRPVLDGNQEMDCIVVRDLSMVLLQSMLNTCSVRFI